LLFGRAAGVDQTRAGQRYCSSRTIVMQGDLAGVMMSMKVSRSDGGDAADVVVSQPEAGSSTCIGVYVQPLVVTCNVPAAPGAVRQCRAGSTGWRM